MKYLYLWVCFCVFCLWEKAKFLCVILFLRKREMFCFCFRERVRLKKSLGERARFFRFFIDGMKFYHLSMYHTNASYVTLELGYRDVWSWTSAWNSNCSTVTVSRPSSGWHPVRHSCQVTKWTGIMWSPSSRSTRTSTAPLVDRLGYG